MTASGLTLLAVNHNAGGKKLAGIAQEGGQGASSKRGSESINNLAQTDGIEQAEEVAVNTKLVAKKTGSPTNINAQEHAASSRGTSEVGQSAGQEASADFKSKSVNNQSEIASVDQAEKISTNLDISVAGARRGHYGHGGYGHGYGHYGRGGYGYCRPGYNGGYGKRGFVGPDSIDVDVSSHMASADLQSTTGQDGTQVAKANHGSESFNNLKQDSTTNQMEDVAVNALVRVGGHGTVLNGPTTVDANDHTASGNAVATSSQSGSQTAISDNASLSVNNMSQSNFTRQTEKVGVNTNVIV